MTSKFCLNMQADCLVNMYIDSIAMVTVEILCEEIEIKEILVHYKCPSLFVREMIKALI